MRYRLGGLIFGGAYTWRGLFSEFYGILYVKQCKEVIDVREDAAQTKDNTLNTNTPVPTTLTRRAKITCVREGKPGNEAPRNRQQKNDFLAMLKELSIL